MPVQELVAWAEEEANSPYLRFSSLKFRPFRNDMKGKVLFTEMHSHEDKENEGINDAAKTLEGMNDVVEGRIEYVEGMNDAAKFVEFIDVVDDNERDFDKNADKYAHLFFESESDESDKSFDYLSNGEDEVTELRKRRIQFKNTTDEEGPTEAKHDMRSDVDKFIDVDGIKRGFLSQKGSGGGRGVKEKNVVLPPLVEEPGLGGPMLEKVTVSGNSSGMQDGNVDCSTNTPVSEKKIGGGTKDSGDATNTPIDENISGPSANVAANVTVSPTCPIPSGSTSYAKLVIGITSKKSVNFRTLYTPTGNEALVGVACPVVANYVGNTWGKYGFVKSMLNLSIGLFFFQFSSMDVLDSMLKNGSWFIRNNPIILKKWNPYVNLMKEDVGNVSVWLNSMVSL
nr:hypothetical protein [Tanacetum cinerariifolium]